MPSALTPDGLDVMFRTARSYNRFAPGEVTAADAEAIYELLKFGPTATNQHPARFVWCITPAARETLAACAESKNADKIRLAPAAVIIATDNEFHEHLPELFPHADARPWFADARVRHESAFRNSTLQGAYLLMAARALGFDTGPISGFDRRKVNNSFFADEPNIDANFIATIGQGDPASIFKRLPRPPFSKFNRVD